ncbi:hypothetical protein KKD81_02845 [Patescibacteria group bacterium]|nr:hypothetical protein [Patescibacteria group bacterium]MBU2158853.1 hypothetical protein [Patescibacteria group bacterium]MBU2220848.1 hypothetical protein [Patescibacteria group bacterium]
MDIWKHGAFVDGWSVVHFLSGFFIALLFYTIGFSIVLTVLCTLAALVLWEVYEWILGILETPPNVAADIVLGSLGAGVALYFYFFRGETLPEWLLLTLFFSMLALSLWGFIDQYKNGYR